MLDFVVQELAATSEWRLVLEAYQVQEKERKGSEAAGDGWLPRLTRVDGVEPARLSALHGKLIAAGYLTFDLSGKSGMHYQLSPLGRRTLARGIPEPSDESLLPDAPEEASGTVAA